MTMSRSFEDDVECAFWKQKILERQREAVEWTRHVIRTTDFGVMKNLDPDAHIPDPWLDEDFEVTKVTFKKGQGEYRLSEYTSDYEDDQYDIRIKFASDGRTTTYPYVLHDHESFGELLREAMRFGSEYEV